MEFSIRMAGVEEAATIVWHRRAMFFDMGYRDEDALDRMSMDFEPWLRRKMVGGEYFAWFAVGGDGSVVGGAGVWLMDWPPHMIGGARPRANILNVYVHPDCRRKGLARRLMDAVMEWLKRRDVRLVVLHASEEGKGLYRALGFQPTNEMRMEITC